MGGYPAILFDVDVLVRLEDRNDVVGEFDTADFAVRQCYCPTGNGCTLEKDVREAFDQFVLVPDDAALLFGLLLGPVQLGLVRCDMMRWDAPLIGREERTSPAPGERHLA